MTHLMTVSPFSLRSLPSHCLVCFDLGTFSSNQVKRIMQNKAEGVGSSDDTMSLIKPHMLPDPDIMRGVKQCLFHSQYVDVI